MFHHHWDHKKYGLWVIVLLIFPYTIQSVLAQDKSIQRKISLQYENISLADLFNIITRETGYTFFYNNQTVNDRIKVSVRERNVPLTQVLERLLESRGYGWEVRMNRIGVFIKEKTANVETPVKKEELFIRGIVTMPDGTALEGATINIPGVGKAGTRTNEKGAFFLNNEAADSLVRISFTGFKTQEIRVKPTAVLRIVLEPVITDLAVVAVRSNGYQKIPAERATGSFVQLNNQLLNRRVGPYILERLEGVASGVLFPNRNIPPYSNEAYISIRGRSTILANAQPLIVVDNFPFTGDINLLNPNDVENITILKDAAAASIWGAFSGNGVIVITTKKSKLHQPLKVEANTNITIGAKPDLFYNPAFLGSNEFIDVEKYLFDKGFYDGDLSNNYSYPVISPVVDLLDKKRSGLISAAEVDADIDQLKKNDIRKDYEKYFYRNSVSQQYAVNVSGGGDKSAYMLSVGYDRILNSKVTDASSRFTINNYSTFHLWDRVELSSGVSFVLNKTTADGGRIALSPSGGKSLYYPYAQLADANGNALPLPKDYRYGFISQLKGDGLLDWTYKPLDELKMIDKVERRYHVRFNPGMKIDIIKGLNAEIRYQFEKQIGKQEDYNGAETYYTRNLYNLFTQVDANGAIHPVPIGGILNEISSELTTNNYRAQLNFNRTFSRRHHIAAVAGVEQRETVTKETNNRYYGYNKENLSYNNQIDFSKYYDAYQYLGAAGYIPNAGPATRYNNEFISYFGNAAYTLNERYIVSASMRLDQSNLWGINTNQKGVPLWSAGLGWDISKESFYKSGWLPYLKIRTTYGYNGNLDPGLYGKLAIIYGSLNIVGLPNASVANRPNPRLRWEKVGTLNIGADFETRNKIVGGSIEYYRKKGVDLIGEQTIAMQTGATVFKGNFADMRGGGLDVNLTTYNINRKISWTTDFLFSYNWDEITRYSYFKGINGVVSSGDGTTSALFPFVGRPVYGVYSYKWAGLDPENGDPQGYLAGKVSKDYNAIVSSEDENSIIYNGPARPTIFGALRNTFSYKQITLSVNLAFKLRYYFKRPSIMYNDLFSAWQGGHKDYLSRWQQPGDELHTNVPSLSYPGDPNRDYFYQYSSVLVEKGDHIRLQDLRIAYSLSPSLLNRTGVKDIQLYFYANNIGIIWKANKAGLDPDYVMGYPAPRTFSFGCSAKF
ncbi:SusC/RagA family TonB-linked outer membrane protein [Chitinophaga ginsengisoli]|uniref:TonB-linked SusC/RagA family outer membrane protein n=1 Tax=Chitinophaga ginsengisoli TaxID=363837 RepID=A0A2P8GD98_9BACT|nr:SusC/RagA family TonB-linked outer membrane protein [Chitinophaga ginsengisoli]PSL31932.1 TonB-linked SusC/RagA family outer membrane protein [Chitinophaga ginsengisoli]